MRNISELEREEEETAVLILNPFDLVINVKSEQIVFPGSNNWSLITSLAPFSRTVTTPSTDSRYSQCTHLDNVIYRDRLIYLDSSGERSSQRLFK